MKKKISIMTFLGICILAINAPAADLKHFVPNDSAMESAAGEPKCPAGYPYEWRENCQGFGCSDPDRNHQPVYICCPTDHSPVKDCVSAQ